MRIDQIDLTLVRLPLVRPFQTSSSRKEHLDHILVRVRTAGRRDRLGRVRQPVRPVLLPRDGRDLLAHPPRLPGPHGSGPGLGDDRGAGRALSARSRETPSPGPGWRWPAGTSGPGQGRPLATAAGRHARPRSSRASAWASRPRSRSLLDRIDQFLAEGYRRIKLKIGPGWDVEVVRRVRERYPIDPAPGRRQLGLHAGRHRHASASSTPSTCS